MSRVKSLKEIKAMVRERTGKQGVFRRARSDDVESVLERLKDKDPDHWAAEWSRVANPIEDLYILLESGSPKAARVFPGGHMGHTPETVPTIIQWLKRELA